MRARSSWLIVLTLCITLGLSDCRREREERAARPPSPIESPVIASPTTPVTFRDISEQAGIDFRHVSGAFGKKYLPETMGSGCAFIDYDGDGWQDILLVNSKDWPGHVRRTTTPRLYRNRRDGTFEDVTRQAGLAIEMYGLGVAVGDYNNDGHDDLYITCLGRNYLFRNNGDGTFTDVTQAAGVECPVWSTSAAWLDYDKDGDLDLFVCNYVQWSIETDIWCTLDGKTKSYCTPESYTGESCRLYRNNGNGTLTDVTKRAGVFDPQSKALGVAILDYNHDGWLDIAVANDTVRNFLFHNNGNGTFKDIGVESGMAYSEAGMARAGMGIDAADYDGSGRESIVIANFSNEMVGVYHNEGRGLFVDMAPSSQVGQASLLFLSFGCFFFDYDLDGWLDLLVVNGHIEPEIEKVQRNVTYKQRLLLFRNSGKGNFTEVGLTSGEVFKRPIVGRGAAYADIDNDGDLDVLISSNNGPAMLLRNQNGSGNHSLRFRLVGSRSNRNGIGAQIRVESGSLTQTRMVKSGSSYCSQSELPVTVGLGQRLQAELVEVVWPSGLVNTFTQVRADQMLTVEEGRGVISASSLRGKKHK